MRPHLALIDGIVGGEGDGPLAPKPVNSGVLIFGDNVVTVDHAEAILMGYDPDSLPIVRNATAMKKYPLLNYNVGDEHIVINAKNSDFRGLGKLATYRYQPPRGCRDNLEARKERPDD